jgi:surface polysaccharide O-acyltransferase-like enzyme
LDNIIKNDRLLWVDITRIVAIIAVVAIHVEDAFIFSWNEISMTDWWVSNVYGGLIRFPVPLFIILSGYLLLDRQEDDRIFFSKRFSKVVIPLVAWSMIYWIFKKNYDVSGIFTVDFAQRLLTDKTYFHMYFLNIIHELSIAAGDFAQRFLANKIYFHLYFLYIILGLYLITPLLRRILVHATMYDIRYYLVVWLFFAPISQLIRLFNYNIGIPVEAATGALGLYVTGYAVKKTRMTRRMMYLSGVLIAVSIIVTIYGTYFLTSKSGRYDGTFTGWLSLTSVIYAAGLFICIREVFCRFSMKGIWPGFGKVISLIGGASMGIYLVHPILLHFVSHGISGVNLLSADVLNPLFSVPLVTFLIVFSSLVVVLLLQELPLIRMIVP